MSLPTQQRVWVVANPPTGPVQPDTFKIETRPLPALGDDSVLLRVDYLSNDPTQRNWIAKDTGTVKQGQVFRSNALATVLKSTSAKWAEGQLVVGYFGWVDYAVVPASSVAGEARQLPGRPAIALGMLGSTGATAYHGIMDVLDVQPEHTVVVSGAAGAVGSTAVQLAKKVRGARVIGIAGGPDKVKFVESLGAVGVDYKSATFAADLRAAVGPHGADRYYENVGGRVLDAMIPNMKVHGKIGLCGLISQYNGGPTELYNLLDLISKRVDMQGFSIADFLSQIGRATGEMAQWVEEGKLSPAAENVVPTPFDKIPVTWATLFSGTSKPGKLITAVQH
ncbi:NAD(P)-binding protein [Cutaneotrichosporon oleaginosum]|uniref:NAD(P)-binding protein n=1 Tax=Cutaneotrichosporon oleaginosum TaxID=879819 RepID=A0A0J0XUD2_9TREE|nr:NAD(P)-binding protein [Cutaneotrichosporon oleaginosum]KLT44652.1 NAD(P)-binding protein [Cutaneotrichosporon oleaginosum]TXT07639.1 hypothetical protein COLE_04563 [Cutaneotrichosporon oleaginosum]